MEKKFIEVKSSDQSMPWIFGENGEKVYAKDLGENLMRLDSKQSNRKLADKNIYEERTADTGTRDYVTQKEEEWYQEA